MKSPLRYPGGKTRAVKILEKYVPHGAHTVVSPFFGGGSFEIALAKRGFRVKANDLFFPLYTFWTTLQKYPTELAQTVQRQMPVSKEVFHSLRRGISNIDGPLDIAASYFIINRCSFNGSTFCGGFSSAAASGRLTESSLKTLKDIRLDQFEFSNLDACDFLATCPETPGVFVYADPPYYISSYIYGKDGDLHESFDHEKFARVIKQRNDWVLSYNDCEYIRKLYSDCTICEEKWSYGMNASKASSEIVIYKRRHN